MDANKIAETILNFNDNVFLYRTSSVSKLDEIAGIKDDATGRPFFEVMYENPDTLCKRMSTVFNAIFTQRMQVFMLSRNSTIKLIKEDLNHDLSLSPSEYKFFLKAISNCGYFQVLREHTQKKAGVYKLIEPDMVKELHRLAAKEYFEEQEKHVLSFFENDRKVKQLMGKDNSFIPDPKNYKSKLSKAVAEEFQKRGIRYDPTKV